MSTSQRRIRELQAREELILDHAQILLQEHGYQGLNLDELAERVEYSKGTLYLHFASKEDLLVAVGVRLTEVRVRLFQAAARYPGLTRERIAAMGVVDFLINQHLPQAFSLCQLAMTASVWENASHLRRTRMQQCLLACSEAPIGVVREALLNGDIGLKKADAEQIVLGLIAMSKGAMLVFNNTKGMGNLGEKVLSSLQENRHRFLDGFQWKPLTDDHDYAAVEKSLMESYFQPDLQSLQLI